MKITKNFRRGQSEIIGAAIALSLLIAVGLSIFATFFRSTTQVSTGLSLRYRFESERIAELKGLEVRYGEDGKCRLINTGNLDVEIVRVWWADGKYKDGSILSSPILKPGGDDGGKLHEQEASYIVTSRGNVVPIKAACEAKKAVTGSTGVGAGELTSENFLNPPKLIGSNPQNKRIVTRVNGEQRERDGNTIKEYGVVYYYNNAWYFNKGDGWRIISFSADEDIDDNGINELIIVVEETQGRNIKIKEYNSSITNNALNVSLTFVELLEVLNNPDVITIHFKILVYTSSPPAHSIGVSTFVEISTEGTSISSTASTSLASFARSKGGGILVIVDSVSFPIRAYEDLRRALTPGRYNLTLTILFVATGGNPSISGIRLEYIAVTGSATFNWRP